MNSDNTFAWIVLLAVVTILYYPVAKRLYRRWKQVRLRKRTHGPLLGVVFPPSDKDQ